MEINISGKIAPKVELRPAAGEGFWCSRGGLMAMTPGVSWRLRVPGGMSGAVSRTLSGEGVALTWVEAAGADLTTLLPDRNTAVARYVYDLTRERELDVGWLRECAASPTAPTGRRCWALLALHRQGEAIDALAHEGMQRVELLEARATQGEVHESDPAIHSR